jgi:hypothetical protein
VRWRGSCPLHVHGVLNAEPISLSCGRGTVSLPCWAARSGGRVVVAEIVALRSVLSPAPRTVWQAVFDRDVEAVPYQSPQWTDALCRSGHCRDASRLYTFDNGVQMVLPLVEHRWVPAVDHALRTGSAAMMCTRGHHRDAHLPLRH